MSESQHSRHQNAEQERNRVLHSHRPYWTRAHRDWRFWGIMFLMLSAILIYVMSQNLALRPPNWPQKPLSGVVEK